jgi:HEAT repeat protein
MKFIGPDALPALLAAATNSQTPWRDRLLMPIAYIAKQNAESASVVPTLLDLLKDQDARVAEETAAALAYIGAQPHLAVPALIKAAQERRATVRCAALSALADFGSHARPAIPLLIRCLDDDHVDVQMSALRTLGFLRLEPKLVVPALMTCVQDSAKEASAHSRQALAVLVLGRYGKAAESAVPLILPLLDDSHLDLRRSATNALKEIAPEKLQVTSGK